MQTLQNVMALYFGGGGEIRTHDPVTRVTVFKTVALDHSATPPSGDIVIFSVYFQVFVLRKISIVLFSLSNIQCST